MKIVYLFPTQAESEPFCRANPQADIRLCGVGAAQAAAAASLVAADSPDAVVLCGIAGAVRGQNVAPCEVVQTTVERIGGLPERYAQLYKPTLRAEGLRGVSSVTVAATGTGTGAQIENMEGAAVMAVCEAHGIGCCQVRVISNFTDEPFGSWRTAEAVEALCEALTKLKFES